MMGEDDRPNRAAISGVFFLLLVVISITPIQSYDYFWHLATGEWILDNGTLPATDPFSLSSDATKWVDGEWAFQIVAAIVHRTAGTTGTSIARAICVAAIFSIGLAVMLRRAEVTTALLVLAISMWGADHRLTTRPETFATLLLVVGLWLLFEYRPGRVQVIAYSALTVLWMGNHPSALLAPAIAGLVLAGSFVTGERGRALGSRAATCVASGVALLVNPWGLEGVVAPLRLARLVGSGTFVNLEWTLTKPSDFPLLYVVVIAGVLRFLSRGRWKSDAPRLLVFILLAALGIRYVRNHGFFYAAIPILAATVLPIRVGRPARLIQSTAAVIVLSALVLRHDGVRVGVDPAQFPVASVAHLKELGLEGNIYNPDQLGGYLISQFYPVRRVLTDGRNELHVSYIEEYGKARLDQRAWNALVKKYELVLAVDEYHRETMEVVDATTGNRVVLPSSLIYFPRARWALIGFDDVAMVFVRRDAVDTETLAQYEFRTLVPDGRVPFLDTSPETLAVARREIVRARQLFGDRRSIERIAILLGE